MTKGERMKEIAKASPDFGKRVGYKMCVVDELHDMKELEEQNIYLQNLIKAERKRQEECDEVHLRKIKELEKENAELKEVHESDKRSLALIAKKGADFEKAYNETEELLDKQIEATYKLFEENKELKEKLGDVQMQKAGEKSDLVWKLKTANEQKAEQLTEAKDLIKRLIKETYGEGWNYSLQVKVEAEQFLKECE